MLKISALVGLAVALAGCASVNGSPSKELALSDDYAPVSSMPPAENEPTVLSKTGLLAKKVTQAQ